MVEKRTLSNSVWKPGGWPMSGVDGARLLMAKEWLSRPDVEKDVPHVYVDTVGCVTVGVGHNLGALNDPEKVLSHARGIAFVKRDGKRAQESDLRAELETLAGLPK